MVDTSRSRMRRAWLVALASLIVGGGGAALAFRRSYREMWSSVFAGPNFEKLVRFTPPRDIERRDEEEKQRHLSRWRIWIIVGGAMILVGTIPLVVLIALSRRLARARRVMTLGVPG